MLYAIHLLWQVKYSFYGCFVPFSKENLTRSLTVVSYALCKLNIIQMFSSCKKFCLFKNLIKVGELVWLESGFLIWLRTLFTSCIGNKVGNSRIYLYEVLVKWCWMLLLMIRINSISPAVSCKRVNISVYGTLKGFRLVWTVFLISKKK